VSENPFEVLKLDPMATEAEIVRQGGVMRQRAAGEEAQTAVRQAVQALTGRAEDRQLFALLTHAGPAHQWPALERLAAAFRHPPTGEQTAPVETPPLDLAEVAALLRPLLIQDLVDEPLPFELTPIDETPEEILKQTIEGVWQILPFEPGA
jgi:hypothetical protein